MVRHKQKPCVKFMFDKLGENLSFGTWIFFQGYPSLCQTVDALRDRMVPLPRRNYPPFPRPLSGGPIRRPYHGEQLIRSVRSPIRRGGIRWATLRLDAISWPLPPPIVAGQGVLPLAGAAPRRRPASIKVVVWDERQPAQKQAYGNFLGNRIADHLRSEPGSRSSRSGSTTPSHGLTPGVLDDAQVLIWWGHVQHKEIGPRSARDRRADQGRARSA